MGVEDCLAEVFGVHFAEAFAALDVDFGASFVGELGDGLLFVFFVDAHDSVLGVVAGDDE